MDSREPFIKRILHGFCFSIVDQRDAFLHARKRERFATRRKCNALDAVRTIFMPSLVEVLSFDRYKEASRIE